MQTCNMDERTNEEKLRDKIMDLEIRLHRISGILYGDLQYEYGDIVEMRNLCNTELSI